MAFPLDAESGMVQDRETRFSWTAKTVFLGLAEEWLRGRSVSRSLRSFLNPFSLDHNVKVPNLR